jgi:hypothetical protein
VGFVPVQGPPHPAKVEFCPGDSVSVTRVPVAKLALQVGPQLIPEGLLVTVPVPLPPTVTDRTAWATLKVAVTCWLVVSVKVQVGALMALQEPPLQPAKDEFEAAVAVRVTWVPLLKVALQLGLQLMPEGVLETVPDPVPTGTTVNTGAL